MRSNGTSDVRVLHAPARTAMAEGPELVRPGYSGSTTNRLWRSQVKYNRQLRRARMELVEGPSENAARRAHCPKINRADRLVLAIMRAPYFGDVRLKRSALCAGFGALLRRV